MAVTGDFSFGSYGDYAGVVFCGPPVDGFWRDRLEVSSRYIDPLFRAILDCSRTENSEPPPQLVQDWNAIAGWAFSDEVVELRYPEVERFISALAALTAPDLLPYCAGSSPEECLDCSAQIRQFLSERMERGVNLFIENW
jgi:hypothetical protein